MERRLEKVPLPDIRPSTDPSWVHRYVLARAADGSTPWPCQVLDPQDKISALPLALLHMGIDTYPRPDEFANYVLCGFFASNVICWVLKKDCVMIDSLPQSHYRDIRKMAESDGSLVLWDQAYAMVLDKCPFCARYFRVYQNDGVFWPAQYVKRPDLDNRIPLVMKRAPKGGDKFCMFYAGNLKFEWVDKKKVIKYKHPSQSHDPVFPAAKRPRVEFDEGVEHVERGHDSLAIFSFWESLRQQNAAKKVGKNERTKMFLADDFASFVRFEDPSSIFEDESDEEGSEDEDEEQS